VADRTVSVALQLKLSGFSNGLRKAKADVNDFGDSLSKHAKKNKADWDTVGAGFLAVGAAAGVGIAAAVKGFADFDQAMSNVKAATHETAGNMAELRQAALDAGRDTAFSATEAAAGIENLAKAGVSTQDILGGGLAGALDLAAAGELGVADAAETAATAMTQFKLQGTQVPHIADLLAAAAGKAQGEVSDMAQALNQSGLVASQFGLSIEETTGTLAAFASAGLIGSDAGTSFKTMLLALANPSKESAELMEDLGINVYDAQGAFIGIAPLAEQLRTRLKDLTQEQRDQALAQIFGNDAVRAANVLYSQGASGIADWTKKVDDAGFAAETAAIKQDNLRGDLEKLMGSFETALIGLGEGANGPLRGLTQRLTSAVDAFDGLQGPAKSAALAAAGVTAAVGLAGGTALIAVPKIVAFNQALASMGPAGLKARAAAGALTRVGGAAAGILELTEALNKAQGTAFRGSLSQLATDLETFGESTVVGGRLAERFGESLDGIAKRGPDIKGLGETLKQALFSDAPFDRLDGNVQTVKALDDALAQLVESGSVDNAKAAFEQISREAAQWGLSMEDLKKLFPDYTSALDTATKAAEAEAEATAKAGAATRGAVTPAQQLSAAEAAKAEALEKSEKKALEQAQALDDLIEKMHRASGAALSLSGAQIGYQEALDSATEAAKENGRVIDKRTGKINLDTAAGRANQAALNSLAEATNDQTDAMIRNGQSNDKVRATAESARKKFVEVARQMGLSKTEAERLSRAYIDIPDSVSTTVTNTAVAAKKPVDTYTTSLHNLPKEKDTKVKTSGIPKAWADIQGFSQNVDKTLSGIADEQIKVGIVYSSKGINLTSPSSVGRRATGGPGGPVRGPGTTTSDTAGLYALSNKEWVIRAASSMKYGDRAMKSVNDGTAVIIPDGGFAAGGSPGINFRASTPGTSQMAKDIAAYMLKAAGPYIKAGAKQFTGPGGPPGARHSFRGVTLNSRTIAMLLNAERMLGAAFHITQGSYSTRVAASGSTHAGGGAMDTNGPKGWNAAVRALRAAGFAAWHRTPSQGPWNHHIHSIAIGDSSASPAAKRQVQSYLAGGNGLGGGSRSTSQRALTSSGLGYNTAKQKFSDGGKVKLTSYDNGGMLPTGPSLVWNGTGRPEPVGHDFIRRSELAEMVAQLEITNWETGTGHFRMVAQGEIRQNNRQVKRDVGQGLVR